MKGGIFVECLYMAYAASISYFISRFYFLLSPNKKTDEIQYQKDGASMYISYYFMFLLWNMVSFDK